MDRAIPKPCRLTLTLGWLAALSLGFVSQCCPCIQGGPNLACWLVGSTIVVMFALVAGLERAYASAFLAICVAIAGIGWGGATGLLAWDFRVHLPINWKIVACYSAVGLVYSAQAFRFYCVSRNGDPSVKFVDEMKTNMSEISTEKRIQLLVSERSKTVEEFDRLKFRATISIVTGLLAAALAAFTLAQ